MSGFESAFESFLADEAAVQAAIRQATRRSYDEQPSGVALELFADGRWRVLRVVGNLYRSQGLLIPVPPLRDSDDDETAPFFGNAIEMLRQNFEYAAEF